MIYDMLSYSRDRDFRFNYVQTEEAKSDKSFVFVKNEFNLFGYPPICSSPSCVSSNLYYASEPCISCHLYDAVKCVLAINLYYTVNLYLSNHIHILAWYYYTLLLLGSHLWYIYCHTFDWLLKTGFTVLYINWFLLFIFAGILV